MPPNSVPPSDPSLSASLSASLRRAAGVAQRSIALVTQVVKDVDRLVEHTTRDAAALADEAQALARDVTTTAERLGVSVRAAPRVARVVTEAARLIGRYRLSPGEPTEALHETSAERVHDLAVSLRGGILKLGQLASCRPDLLPAPWITWLSRLQDRVPPIDALAIRARIEAELGAPIAELFRDFDDTPLACASIAQVHGATLPDGRPVVVKVQLPGIEDIVEADLVAMRLVAAMLGDLLPKMDLPTIVNELGRTVRGELDFVAEADALGAARAAFAGDSAIHVPRPERTLCSRRVLVMERLYGQPLGAFLAEAEARGEAGRRDRDRAIGTMVRAYAVQILVHGRFQADAHPGNFLIATGESGPVVGLLDFGCTCTLSPAQRRAYAGVVGAVLSRDRKSLAAALGAMGFATKDGGSDTLERFAEMMLGAFRDQADLASIDPRALFDEALAALRQDPIVSVPQEFVMIGRVFASVGGLVLHHKPKLELFSILGPALAQAMREPAPGA
jgi:ubiquinone biosynthesis protein